MDLNGSACGICSSKEYVLLFKKRVGEITFEIVRCQNCGLVYTHPFPKYSEERYNEYPTKRYLENEKAYYSFYRPILKEILAFKKKGKFLEIGCSVGYLLKLAHNEGFKVNGTELSKNAVKASNVLLGKGKVKYGYLENCCFPDNYFDVIAMNHVLEHIFDLSKILRQIKKKLKDDGILFIGAPNFNNLIVKILKNRWKALRVNEHIWHFKSGTIKKLLTKEGFQVIESKPIGPSIKNIFLAIRSMVKKESFLNQNLFHRLLIIQWNILYYLLSWVTGKIGYGDNMFIIAKKIIIRK